MTTGRINQVSWAKSEGLPFLSEEERKEVALEFAQCNRKGLDFAATG